MCVFMQKKQVIINLPTLLKSNLIWLWAFSFLLFSFHVTTRRRFLFAYLHTDYLKMYFLQVIVLQKMLSVILLQ